MALVCLKACRIVASPQKSCSSIRTELLTFWNAIKWHFNSVICGKVWNFMVISRFLQNLKANPRASSQVWSNEASLSYLTWQCEWRSYINAFKTWKIHVILILANFTFLRFFWVGWKICATSDTHIWSYQLFPSCRLSCWFLGWLPHVKIIIVCNGIVQKAFHRHSWNTHSFPA